MSSGRLRPPRRQFLPGLSHYPSQERNFPDACNDELAQDKNAEGIHQVQQRGRWNLSHLLHGIDYHGVEEVNAQDRGNNCSAYPVDQTRSLQGKDTPDLWRSSLVFCFSGLFSNRSSSFSLLTGTTGTNSLAVTRFSNHEHAEVVAPPGGLEQIGYSG